MENIVVIAGEPYLRDELLFRADPEEFIWQAELTAYMESCFAEEDW